MNSVLDEIRNLEVVNTGLNDCNGRHCTKCGQCRDWFYTGDLASLTWLRNWKNWSKSDWERYRDNDFSKCLKKRINATCRFSLCIIDGNDILASVHLHFLGADYGLHIHADLCLCNDNIRE